MLFQLLVESGSVIGHMQKGKQEQAEDSEVTFIAPNSQDDDNLIGQLSLATGVPGFLTLISSTVQSPLFCSSRRDAGQQGVPLLSKAYLHLAVFLGPRGDGHREDPKPFLSSIECWDTGEAVL